MFRSNSDQKCCMAEISTYKLYYRFDCTQPLLRQDQEDSWRWPANNSLIEGKRCNEMLWNAEKSANKFTDVIFNSSVGCLQTGSNVVKLLSPVPCRDRSPQAGCVCSRPGPTAAGSGLSPLSLRSELPDHEITGAPFNTGVSRGRRATDPVCFFFLQRLKSAKETNWKKMATWRNT